jgi:hypothetical protein
VAIVVAATAIRAFGPICFVGIETVDGRVIDHVEVGELPLPVYARGLGAVGQLVATRWSASGAVLSAVAEVEAESWEAIRNSVGGCHVAPDLHRIESVGPDRGVLRVKGTLAAVRLCDRGTSCGAWGNGTYLLSQ